jgi:type II secretory pathway component GspD/PulD (secretin)
MGALRGVLMGLRCLAVVVLFSVTAVAALGSDQTLRLSLHAEAEPARAAVLRASKLFHRDASIAGDLGSRVTVDLHDVTFEEALDAIAASGRLRVRYDHGIAFVTSDPIAGGSGAAPIVLQLAVIRAEQAASSIRAMFPDASVRADLTSNTIIVSASGNDLQAIRSIVGGLDVADPTRPTVESIPLRSISPVDAKARIASLFRNATITVGSKTSLLVRATPSDLAQVKAIIGSLDATVATPMPISMVVDTVNLQQRQPGDVARAVSHELPTVRAAVSGSAVVVTGLPDDVARAKVLIASLDVPPLGTATTVVYRLRNTDAGVVADFLAHPFPAATFRADKDLNALVVSASPPNQQSIADAIGRLDGTNSTPGAGYADPGFATSEVIQLQSVIPSQANGSSSSTAQDIANAVTQTLQSQADLHIVVPSNLPELILSGSPTSVRKAKELIARLDVVPPSVVLDTEILELDETGSKNLGLQLSTALSSTFTEITPPNDPTTGLPARIAGLQPLTRTPLSFQATVNLLLQYGDARVLADPRITTLSGHTASIRAGDTISILTTAGGGTGTVATTQLQSFQTGVQLDITPAVATDGGVTVALHPVVNSLEAYNNGVPQISTRDTQTTVHLQNNETLIIGGLIQDSVQRTINKIPLLGDLPLIGGAFRNSQVNTTKNELVIVVTPHIVGSAGGRPEFQAQLPAAPLPQALPTPPPHR